MNSEKYVTLFSNACMQRFRENRCERFTNQLSMPLQIEGDWQVSLFDITFPFKCANIDDQISIGFLVPCRIEKDISISHENMYSNIDMLLPCDEIGVDSQPMISDSDSLMQNESGLHDMASNEAISYVFRSGYIEAGYYRSIRELGCTLVSLFETLYSDLFHSGSILSTLKFTFNSHHNQSTFYACQMTDSTESMPIAVLCSSSSFLHYNFGLDCNPIVFRDGAHLFKVTIDKNGTRSTNACNLDTFTRLYVCSNIVDFQFFGPYSNRLLSSITIDDNNQSIVKVQPRYVNVERQNIECIEIDLYSNIQTLKPFQFPNPQSDSDVVECTLHFKRCSLLQNCI